MLRRTFCHVPGIGIKAEQRLWDAGAVSWDTADAAGETLGARRRETLLRHVEESHRQLADNNPRFFAETLPAVEHWRLYSDFRGSVAYLDIETTGLGGPGDHITTIALYDGRVTCGLDALRSDVRVAAVCQPTRPRRHRKSISDDRT